MKICISSSKTSKGCWRFKVVWEVQKWQKTVLTSLQGAWHNHGHRMHCMVRSSTMGSWAKPTIDPIPHPLSVPLAISVGGDKISKPLERHSVERISCSWTSIMGRIYPLKGARVETQAPDVGPKLNPRCNTGLPLEEKCGRWEHLQNKKRLVIGHTHCGKRGCAQTATNPTHQCASSHLAMHGRKILRNSVTNLETRHSEKSLRFTASTIGLRYCY